jgi:uncharacterized protein (DUF58 family)
MLPREVLRQIRRLQLRARRAVEDLLGGEYHSVFKGTGIAFEEVREYQPGDDIRTIDWNVTARLGSAYVKRYLEERELTVLFVADQSASARFGSVRRTKGDLTTEVCAVLALAAARNNDRVGAVFATDRVEHYVAPRKGRRQALRVISDLLAFEPRHPGTDLRAALAYLEPMLRRRAVIFLLSDFMGSGYEPSLSRLARRHDLIAIQIVDPRERELPDVGLVTLWDAENGGWRVVDTSDGGLRERFRSRAAEFDGRLERTLLESGADLLRLETGASYAEPLLAFFRRRESRLWR